MMEDSFYTNAELAELGLAQYGEHVLISRKASLYSPETIRIGDDVRIDDFCILSGHIRLGSRIHISAYSALYGSNGIEFRDDTICSARSVIYSAVDDFSGEYLVGPMYESSLRGCVEGRVVLERFSAVCAGSIVFPGVRLLEGAVLGAQSLLKHDAEPWTIYAGVPARIIKPRSRDMLQLVRNGE